MLVACSQQVAQIDESSRAPLPEADYEQALSQGADVYRVDPQQSLILVRVGRAGRMQRLGHDHAVASEDVQGLAAIYEDLPVSHADVVFPVRNLVVDKIAYRERLALDTAPTDEDIAGTYSNMLKVLEPQLHPWVSMRARIGADEFDRPQLAVSITLHGTTAEFLVPAQLHVSDRELRVSGRTNLRHEDFGLEPYSAAGGLLRVADELGVEFELVAQRVTTL